MIPNINDRHSLAVLATFVHELLNGTYKDETILAECAREVLKSVNLSTRDDVVNLNYPVENPPTLFLSRRNLQTLINKLDRNRIGGNSQCGLIKYYNKDDPKEFRQTEDCVFVFAVEDEEYYKKRLPGAILNIDTPK